MDEAALYSHRPMKPRNTVRTSLDIPASLHRRLHEAAARSGCSARELILRSIERLVEEEGSDGEYHVKLPLVPAAGRQIRPVSNDEALFAYVNVSSAMVSLTHRHVPGIRPAATLWAQRAPNDFQLSKICEENTLSGLL